MSHPDPAAFRAYLESHLQLDATGVLPPDLRDASNIAIFLAQRAWLWGRAHARWLTCRELQECLAIYAEQVRALLKDTPEISGILLELQGEYVAARGAAFVCPKERKAPTAHMAAFCIAHRIAEEFERALGGIPPAQPARLPVLTEEERDDLVREIGFEAQTTAQRRQLTRRPADGAKDNSTTDARRPTPRDENLSEAESAVLEAIDELVSRGQVTKSTAVITRSGYALSQGKAALAALKRRGLLVTTPTGYRRK